MSIPDDLIKSVSQDPLSLMDQLKELENAVEDLDESFDEETIYNKVKLASYTGKVTN